MIFPEVVSIVSLVGSIDFFLSLSFSHYQRTDKEDRVLEEENNRVLEEENNRVLEEENNRVLEEENNRVLEEENNRVLEEENNRVLEEKEINEGLDAVLEAWMYYREKPNKNEMYLLK